MNLCLKSSDLQLSAPTAEQWAELAAARESEIARLRKEHHARLEKEDREILAASRLGWVVYTKRMPTLPKGSKVRVILAGVETVVTAEEYNPKLWRLAATKWRLVT